MVELRPLALVARVSLGLGDLDLVNRLLADRLLQLLCLLAVVVSRRLVCEKRSLVSKVGGGRVSIGSRAASKPGGHPLVGTLPWASLARPYLLLSSQIPFASLPNIS